MTRFVPVIYRIGLSIVGSDRTTDRKSGVINEQKHVLRHVNGETANSSPALEEALIW